MLSIRGCEFVYFLDGLVYVFWCYIFNVVSMLIDSNAYIGHWPFRRFNSNTLEALLKLMDEFGVAFSLVSNLHGVFYKNTQHSNEELYDLIRSKMVYRDRFIPIAVLNPTFGGWQYDFAECIDHMGMKGVRLYPRYHNYDITHPNCIELVKMCRDSGIPIIFSMRMVDSRSSSWLDLEKEWSLRDIMPVIRAVPDAKYLVVNASNSLGLNEEDQELLKKVKVLVDTSGRLPGWPVELLKNLGSGKFCFGTHAPLLDYASGLIRVESLDGGEVSREEKEGIRTENIRRLFGI